MVNNVKINSTYEPEFNISYSEYPEFRKELMKKYDSDCCGLILSEKEKGNRFVEDMKKCGADKEKLLAHEKRFMEEKSRTKSTLPYACGGNIPECWISLPVGSQEEKQSPLTEDEKPISIEEAIKRIKRMEKTTIQKYKVERKTINKIIRGLRTIQEES